MDNSLARSQLGIGESTNIAQIAQSYGYTFNDKDYEMYNALLATICQCCIDNAKRTFAIDINAEIKRIKNELEIKKNGLPKFWKVIKGQDGIDYSDRINYNIVCPMNVLQDIRSERQPNKTTPIPLLSFCRKVKPTSTYRENIKVEEFLKKYGLEKYRWAVYEEKTPEAWYKLKDDFDEVINDIKQLKLSKNYLGLCSWLIQRAFSDKEYDRQKVLMFKDKKVLLTAMYQITPKNLLKIFEKE